MPRILCYVHAYQGHGREAGAETTMANLLESLVEAGWEAQVLLSHPDIPAYTRWGVPVRSEAYDSEFLELASQADVLISHLECSERTSLVGRKVNKPVVQLIHNTMWQTEGYLNEGCELAIYNSQWVADYHNSVNPDGMVRLAQKATAEMGQRISFRVPRTRTRNHVIVHPQIRPEDYSVPPNVICDREYVTLINLHDNKGPHIFWEMARRFPHQKFMAVQGGYGKQEIPEVIPPNVRMIGNTPLIRQVYEQTKVLLMPSTYESFGRVAIEAAAQGVPTIASPTPGLREALGSGGLYATTPEEYETILRDLLDWDLFYARNVKYALDRSAYWDNQRSAETTQFIEAISKLVPGR